MKSSALDLELEEATETMVCEMSPAPRREESIRRSLVNSSAIHPVAAVKPLVSSQFVQKAIICLIGTSHSPIIPQRTLYGAAMVAMRLSKMQFDRAALV